MFLLLLIAPASIQESVHSPVIGWMAVIALLRYDRERRAVIALRSRGEHFHHDDQPEIDVERPEQSSALPNARQRTSPSPVLSEKRPLGDGSRRSAVRRPKSAHASYATITLHNQGRSTSNSLFVRTVRCRNGPKTFFGDRFSARLIVRHIMAGSVSSAVSTLFETCLDANLRRYPYFSRSLKAEQVRSIESLLCGRDICNSSNWVWKIHYINFFRS